MREKINYIIHCHAINYQISGKRDLLWSHSQSSWIVSVLINTVYSELNKSKSVFSLVGLQCMLVNVVNKSVKMVDFQPPPFRTLDDFLLCSARLSVPDVRNLDRWNNRIINNLLYYQSNYFAFAAAFLFIVG